MNIYLVRHGEAEKTSTSKKDFERELTPEGIKSLKAAAEGWKKLINKIDFIVTSPLTRAVQTAEIISKILSTQNGIIKDKRLASGGKTDDLIEIANSLEGEDIIFVGHEPEFSRHVSALVSSSGAFVDFKKGMIAKISFEKKAKPARGLLEYLIPAKSFLSK
jgi:phosphohistidine phosphatase